MFIGEYKTSITDGNRIAIPKKLRNQLEGELILTRGYEGCVVLVGKSNFENLMTGMTELPFILADKRETARFLLSGAHEAKPDRQGRVVVPDNLSTYADFKHNGEVVFIGVGSWIEIWDVNKWLEYQIKLDEQAPEIADRLARLGDQKLESKI